MKILNYILLVSLLLTGMYSCHDDWDSHYGHKDAVIDNVNVVIVDERAAAYLQNESSYSSMYKLFEKTGVFQTIKEKQLPYTIMVVNNENSIWNSTRSENEDQFMAKSHITDGAISPSNLKEEQRLLMWNSKYVNITTQDAESDKAIIAFNGARVKKVIKTSDAYIYELETRIHTPQSLMEVLEGLDDNYSIFKNLVLDRIERTFDKSASTPIGIDPTGNTIYDSIFTFKSSYFEKVKMNLYSESMHATMLIPSNTLVEKALSEARQNLKDWNMERADSILVNWIFQSAFFDKEYSKIDFGNTEIPDIRSVFNKQWRTTINKVNVDNPIEMSNGVAYYVNSLKIPTNEVLIWRIKGLFNTYTGLTDSEKATYYNLYPMQGSTYFSGENIVCQGVKNYGGTYQPNTTWPKMDYSAMILEMTDKKKKSVFDFKCHKIENHNDGTHTVIPYTLPPGEYYWHMGFYNKYSKVDVTFFLNNEKITFIPSATVQTMSWDRGGFGYNELYTTDSKYDRDGSLVGVVTVKGDKPVELNIRLEFTAAETAGLRPYHWCFRPTENCY